MKLYQIWSWSNFNYLIQKMYRPSRSFEYEDARIYDIGVSGKNEHSFFINFLTLQEPFNAVTIPMNLN